MKALHFAAAALATCRVALATGTVDSGATTATVVEHDGVEALLKQMEERMQAKLEEQQQRFDDELRRVERDHARTSNQLKNLATRVMMQELSEQGGEEAQQEYRYYRSGGDEGRARSRSRRRASADTALGEETARRSLSKSGASGIFIKTDDASISFGANNDVQLVRRRSNTAAVVGNLEVTGHLVGAAHANGTIAKRICVGHTPHVAWTAYNDEDVYQDIDISQCQFTETPEIFTSMSGNGWHWMSTGVTSLYDESATSFRVYIHHISDDVHSIDYSATRAWSMNWMAIGA